MRFESVQCHAEPVATIVFCDTGLFFLAMSKNVGPLACGYHDFGYSLDCVLLPCLLFDLRLDRCLDIWLFFTNQKHQLLWYLLLLCCLGYSTLDSSPLRP